MKAYVDKGCCIGCGLCESICSEVFKIGDDGMAESIVDEMPESAVESSKEAAASCPVNAITIE